MTGNLSSGGLQTKAGGELARRRSERGALFYNRVGGSHSTRVRRNSGAPSMGTITTARSGPVNIGASVSPRSLPVGQQQEQELLNQLKFNYLVCSSRANLFMDEQLSSEYSNELSQLMSDFKHRAKLIQQSKWNDYETYVINLVNIHYQKMKNDYNI